MIVGKIKKKALEADIVFLDYNINPDNSNL